MDIIRQKGSLDTTEHGVENDTNGQQETSRCRRHASEITHDSRASGKQHSGHEDISDKAERDVDSMSGYSISGFDDL